jgi:hypothetical protein
VCNFIAIPITLREAHLDCCFNLTIQENGFDMKLLRDETICSDDV